MGKKGKADSEAWRTFQRNSSWKEILRGLSEGSRSSGIGGRGAIEESCQEVMIHVSKDKVIHVSKDKLY